MATDTRQIANQSIYDSSTVDILCDWDKFSQMLLDRIPPGARRLEILQQERYEWQMQIAGSDGDRSAPDSQEAELWADLPTSSDYEGSDAYFEQE